MSGGTYTLLLEREATSAIEVGATGVHRFPAGWYAYTGSARGPGGFARVDRHHDVATDRNEARQWHVDYLLGDPTTRIRGDVRSPGVDIECVVASRLPDGPVKGFGASDCDCPSHLAYAPDGDELRAAVSELHRRLGHE